MRPEILLLDNEWEYLIRWRKHLIGEGINERVILDTTNPNEALTFLKENKSDIAIFVSDYDLGNNYFGDEVIIKAKEIIPSLYCILTSTAHVQEKAAEAGVDFSPKFDEDTLIHLICERRRTSAK